MTVNTATPLIEDSAVALISLLERQLSLFEQLHSYTEQQTASIAGSDTDTLLRVLSQRQQALTQAAAIDQQIEPYRRRWPEFYSALSPEHREHVGGLLKQVQEMLGSILQRDEQDRKKLEAQRTRISAEMGKINTAGNALRAYGKPAATAAVDPRFADRQG